MTRDEAEALLGTLSPRDVDGLFRHGIDILRGDCPEALIDAAAVAAKLHPGDVRAQQLLGLAARALGQSRVALQAFQAAARLSPNDALIAHSHARAALEAGRPALGLFERALQRAPNDGSVLLGRAAAQLAEGQTGDAIARLTDVVRANPLWIDGHRALARLRGQEGLDPTSVLIECIAALPGHAQLHREHVVIHLEARDLPAAARASAAAAAQFGRTVWITELDAHIASESGRFAEADRLFAVLGAPQRVDQAGQLARHLVRAARPDAAAALIEPWLDRDSERLLWPYLSLAWRMSGDPRWRWLEGDEALVRTYDIGDRVGDLEALASHLRGLHMARTAPLDQSVRGGTQTDGHLLLRDEAPIVRLRAALLDAVEAYIAQLPPPVSGHPFLIGARAPLRIAGSWSVRLQDRGFHSDHVHNQGWISSALYIALPGQTPEGARQREGWLSLGEARDLVPGLDPVRLVEPRPGRLVLFPSTMWHGTRPFPAGERLTVAFDIARPPRG